MTRPQLTDEQIEQKFLKAKPGRKPGASGGGIFGKMKAHRPVLLRPGFFLAQILPPEAPGRAAGPAGAGICTEGPASAFSFR